LFFLGCLNLKRWGGGPDAVVGCEMPTIGEFGGVTMDIYSKTGESWEPVDGRFLPANFVDLCSFHRSSLSIWCPLDRQVSSYDGHGYHWPEHH